MNGDGLPDQILKNKQVRINLGYTFSDPMDWGLERIQGGESKAFNAGASGGAGGGMGEELVKGSSINKASGSFMAGFGIVSSESKEEYNLMDVNSDGCLIRFGKTGTE